MFYMQAVADTIFSAETAAPVARGWCFCPLCATYITAVFLAVYIGQSGIKVKLTNCGGGVATV